MWLQSPEHSISRSRDPSPIVASVAALESKLDKCLKAVSKAYAGTARG